MDRYQFKIKRQFLQKSGELMAGICQSSDVSNLIAEHTLPVLFTAEDMQYMTTWQIFRLKPWYYLTKLIFYEEQQAKQHLFRKINRQYKIFYTMLIDLKYHSSDIYMLNTLSSFVYHALKDLPEEQYCLITPCRYTKTDMLMDLLNIKNSYTFLNNVDPNSRHAKQAESIESDIYLISSIVPAP